MDRADPLEIFNLVVSILFTGLVGLAFLRMFYRLGRFLFSSTPVPLLLKRDLILFGILGSYTGASLILRAEALNWIREEPLWVVPSSLALLASIGFWTYVEFFRLDK